MLAESVPALRGVDVKASSLLRNSRPAVVGVLVAIAATTAMDANGLSAFSALPLLPLMGLFWYLEGLPREELGFRWGGPREYGPAVLFPVVVFGALALAAFAAGAIDLSETRWVKAGLNWLLVTVSTVLVVIVTEEGFFRGWLFASLGRAGLAPRWIVVWSSVAFSLWHISAVTLSTGFEVPLRQIPIFLLNAAALGAVWGLLRERSGSVIVASVSHGVWNGGAYVLFGFGTRVGALGIQETAIFGPEVGVLGLALNLMLTAALWRSRPPGSHR
jgi:CAAX protease family protein